MAWIHLLVAILFEVVGTLLMKRSDGFSNLVAGVFALAAYGICLVFLGIALKSIPVAVAYSIWSGMGIAIVSLAGWFLFRESLTGPRLLFIVLIAASCIGLQLSGPSETAPSSTVRSGQE
ncbi:MAG: multidrug efflux SMR transporter [Fibrobacteria bacterium]|nr:multidrug efflux SMR transporter [Fibrobacteria bacterium]